MYSLYSFSDSCSYSFDSPSATPVEFPTIFLLKDCPQQKGESPDPCTFSQTESTPSPNHIAECLAVFKQDSSTSLVQPSPQTGDVYRLNPEENSLLFEILMSPQIATQNIPIGMQPSSPTVSAMPTTATRDTPIETHLGTLSPITINPSENTSVSFVSPQTNVDQSHYLEQQPIEQQAPLDAIPNPPASATHFSPSPKQHLPSNGTSLLSPNSIIGKPSQTSLQKRKFSFLRDARVCSEKKSSNSVSHDILPSSPFASSSVGCCPLSASPQSPNCLTTKDEEHDSLGLGGVDGYSLPSPPISASASRISSTDFSKQFASHHFTASTPPSVQTMFHSSANALIIQALLGRKTVPYPPLEPDSEYTSLLTKLIEEMRLHQVIPLDLVVTPDMILMHWHRILDPKVHKGQWKHEENKFLISVLRSSYSSKKVPTLEELIIPKNEDLCTGTVYNPQKSREEVNPYKLHPDLPPLEAIPLLEGIAAHAYEGISVIRVKESLGWLSYSGHNWVQIAQSMFHRSDIQCRDRWKRLLTHILQNDGTILGALNELAKDGYIPEEETDLIVQCVRAGGAIRVRLNKSHQIINEEIYEDDAVLCLPKPVLNNRTVSWERKMQNRAKAHAVKIPRSVQDAAMSTLMSLAKENNANGNKTEAASTGNDGPTTEQPDDFDEQPIVTRRGRWTEEEDQALTLSVLKHGAGNWSEIAQDLGNHRTDQQCLRHWMKVLNPSIQKGRFSKEEDKKILAIVKRIGTGKWSEVAKWVQGRTDKQVHLRYITLIGGRKRSRSKPTNSSERKRRRTALKSSVSNAHPIQTQEPSANDQGSSVDTSSNAISPQDTATDVPNNSQTEELNIVNAKTSIPYSPSSFSHTSSTTFGSRGSFPFGPLDILEPPPPPLSVISSFATNQSRNGVGSPCLDPNFMPHSPVPNESGNSEFVPQ